MRERQRERFREEETGEQGERREKRRKNRTAPTNTFLAAKSLCIIPSVCKCNMPAATPLIMFLAVCHFIFVSLCSSAYRDPPFMYSVTMQKGFSGSIQSPRNLEVEEMKDEEGEKRRGDQRGDRTDGTEKNTEHQQSLGQHSQT